MSRRRVRQGGFAAVAMVIAACGTYHAPPPPVPSAGEWNARRLDDLLVLASLDSLGVRGSPRDWSDWALAQAAWALRPERARVAAEVRVAAAAGVAAGAGPPLGVGTEAEYSFDGAGRESRWAVAFRAILTLETGGKRGARRAVAAAGSLAALARAAMEGWQVRWRVREAALQEHLAERRRDALWPERQALDSVLEGAGRRYGDGGIGSLTLSQWQLQLVDLRREEAVLQVAVTEAHAALADAVGVPVAELDRVVPGREVRSGCHPGERRDSLQAVALEHRLELRSALAEYAVREAEVRLAVAERWPDLELGPGLFFDHGVAKWIISFAVPGLPSARERGAVLQAEARRAVAGQTVLQVQESSLAQLDRALASCSAWRQAVDGQEAGAERSRLAMVGAQYRRGEIGRLEVQQSGLEVARAERRVSEVAARLEEAGLVLEAALGVWGGAPEEPWDR